jgi:hypothetical protein
LDLLCGLVFANPLRKLAYLAASLRMADQSNESMSINMIEDRTGKVGAAEIAA